MFHSSKSSLIFSRSGSIECMSLSDVGRVYVFLFNGSPVSVETSNSADDASPEAANTFDLLFLVSITIVWESKIILVILNFVRHQCSAKSTTYIVWENANDLANL